MPKVFLAASSFGQHRKFPSQARKTSGTQGNVDHQPCSGAVTSPRAAAHYSVNFRLLEIRQSVNRRESSEGIEGSESSDVSESIESGESIDSSKSIESIESNGLSESIESTERGEGIESIESIESIEGIEGDESSESS